MKKTYASPDVEVIIFEKKDVITASGAEIQPVEHDNGYLKFIDF